MYFILETFFGHCITCLLVNRHITEISHVRLGCINNFTRQLLRSGMHSNSSGTYGPFSQLNFERLVPKLGNPNMSHLFTQYISTMKVYVEHVVY